MTEKIRKGGSMIPKMFGFSIDKPGTALIETALDIERVNNDSVLVHVSIADPTELVPIDGYNDIRAFNNCFTSYQAKKQKPMLPFEIVDKSSFIYNWRRPAVTISMPMSVHGAIVGKVSVKRTVFTNNLPLTFLMAEDRIHSPKREVDFKLAALADLAWAILKRRQENGALSVYLPQRGICSTETGMLVKASEPMLDAHLIVQEFHILVNKLLAKFVSIKGCSMVHRCHQPQGNHRGRIGRTDVLNLIDIALDEQQRKFDVIRQKLQFYLQGDHYSADNFGHFGLNLQYYGNFTAPVRSLPDLTNMRVLLACIEGRPSPYMYHKLNTIAWRANQQ